MTFEFFLPQNGTLKNIHLTLTDTQQKQSYTFRTSLRIPETDWDKEKQRPLNIYLKKYKRLNAKLDEIKLQLTEYITERKEERKEPMQRAMAKRIKDICSGKKPELSENSLLFFIKWYMDTKIDLISHSTYKRYKVFFHLMERFEGFRCERLYIEKINSDFVRDFVRFGKEEEYSDNTIYRSIHFVKTILNFAERKRIKTCVKELEIRREKQQREIVTLTEREIEQIKQTNVPEELQDAKDWLLISCYTGQRFSDFMGFKKEQLKEINGRICIAFTQKKTKKEIVLPLHPVVLKVIKRNNGQFPKPMEMREYNSQIKEIARLSELKNSVKARIRTAFRSKDTETEKWETVSSHIGRRSFATNFYGKIPTPLLMEATGHSTEQVFRRYINTKNEERIVSLGRYFERVMG
ncbi:MAG: tyrosine-type recombinase/integrase [Bergeyella sp.]